MSYDESRIVEYGDSPFIHFLSLRGLEHLSLITFVTRQLELVRYIVKSCNKLSNVTVGYEYYTFHVKYFSLKTDKYEDCGLSCLKDLI